MCFQFRSIINVFLIILYTNTSKLSFASINDGDYHEHVRILENLLQSAEQVCMSQECCSSKKEPNTEENTETTTMASSLVRVEFEVFGKVQGVFFRKNTVEQAQKLQLKGWCMNTPSGTVKGAMEGESSKIKEMKHWLSNIGSKMSRIDKAEFRDEKTISDYTFKNFSVRH